jgi:F420 biosynthesis protein FbiB-like protein
MDLEPQALLQWLCSRRSIRRFKPDPVPEPMIQRILETAAWAPSAHNRQPWRFVLVQARENRQILAERMGAEFRRDLLADGIDPAEVESQVGRSRDRILEAPVLVMLCLDPSELDRYPDQVRTQAELAMAAQSVALAGGTILLAAHAQGLGGVWVCAPLFAQEAVRLALDLPSAWRPQGMILLGYPAKVPDPRPRRPYAETVVIR